MSIRFVESAPASIRYFPDIAALGEFEASAVAEIFQTPLTGAYNWDYDSKNSRIRRLYSLGKTLNWNQELDLDWSQDCPRDESPVDTRFNPFAGFAPFEAMEATQQTRFFQHHHAWALSQFLHGEQGALLVASQLTSCAPSVDAKLYAASQTFDEARHVETFNRYLQEKVGFMYPVNPHLKALLDKILSDPRWDLKFIGMQIVIEGLAMAAFSTMRLISRDPLLKDIIRLVTRDEARHVTFGVNYLEGIVRNMPAQDVEQRAQFAYEACVVMRERLIATEVFAEFGWDVPVARQRMLDASVMEYFRKVMFSRIVPNLSRIGLLTESVRLKFEALGILDYANPADDGAIDWVKLSRPL